MKVQINIVPREFEAKPNADELSLTDWSMEEEEYPVDGELIVVSGRGAPMLALAKQIATQDYRPVWGWVKVQT